MRLTEEIKLTVTKTVNVTYKWVSCSRETNYSFSREAHVVRSRDDNGFPGMVTTLCNATGSGEGVWRRDSKKPRCAECAEKLARKIKDHATGS